MCIFQKDVSRYPSGIPEKIRDHMTPKDTQGWYEEIIDAELTRGRVISSAFFAGKHLETGTGSNTILVA